MQDKMTDYPNFPPNAPSVDVFTADELLVLSEWFEVEHPRSERSVENILDEWDIPQDISEYRRLDAAVAQILLERVRITFRSGPRSLTTAFSSPDQSRIGAHCGRRKCCRVVFSRLTGPKAAPASHGQWPTTPPTYRNRTVVTALGRLSRRFGCL